jgi:hypothetical protein
LGEIIIDVNEIFDKEVSYPVLDVDERNQKREKKNLFQKGEKLNITGDFLISGLFIIF